MVILCLPGESLAGLISKGRVICPQTCSRAELPSALLNLLSQVALMPEWPLYLLRTTRNSKKRDVITGNRNRKETWRTLRRPGAEFGSTLSCSLACAGKRAAAGSGGLFIAKVLYQTPGSSLLSCCSCLVGCRYKLGCRRCWELLCGSFPDYCARRVSNEISATRCTIFFNYQEAPRKSSIVSKGGTLSFFWCV